MNKIYIQNLFIILALLFSCFSYAQNPKSQTQELKETTETFIQAETLKALETKIAKKLVAEMNDPIVKKTMKKIWESAKGLNKKQVETLFKRYASASKTNLNKLMNFSPSRLSSYVSDVTSNIKVDVKTLKKIIYGTGDKAGNAVLKTLSEMDEIIAKTGKLPKHILKAMRDEASGLNPKQARAFYDLLKEKMSKDLTNIGDLKTPGKGPGGMVGTVVDGVFVLFDAYDIYYSDEDPEVKGIKATAKIIDYGASTGAGAASAALGGGLGPGLVIAFTANRVSTLYTEIAMLQKEQQNVADIEENQKINNGIFARSQLVNISQLIKSGQLKKAKFKLSKLRNFLQNNKFNNVTMLSKLRYKLEENLKKAKYNERVNKEINNARFPYLEAYKDYKRGMQLNTAKYNANKALKMLKNGAKTYPEINELQAIPRVKSLLAAINKKIANAGALVITNVNAPKQVSPGEDIEIPVYVKGGIPYYSGAGSIYGNTSDKPKVTFNWTAPSKPGIQKFTLKLQDCMGSIASTLVSIEVAENIEDKKDEEIELNLDGIDGIVDIEEGNDIDIEKIRIEFRYRGVASVTRNFFNNQSDIDYGILSQGTTFTKKGNKIIVKRIWKDDSSSDYTDLSIEGLDNSNNLISLSFNDNGYYSDPDRSREVTIRLKDVPFIKKRNTSSNGNYFYAYIFEGDITNYILEVKDRYYNSEYDEVSYKDYPSNCSIEIHITTKLDF
ncbi:hypothetical protein [uncultured Lutibacter sp.]|uniref:hypothetical protein n=1 Tax=uncultured Lutibacter sp. TaxID=437739 RepID=UPI0026203909|nr:hypothetical protein [uncultured Lutibacter sp.]